MSLAGLNLRSNPFEEMSELWIGNIEKFFVKKREDYLIDEVVTEVASLEGSGLLVLIGDRGVGKSVRLARIRRNMLRKGGMCIFNDVEPGIISSTVRRILIEALDRERSWSFRLKKKLGFPVYSEVEGLHNGSLSPTDAAEIVMHSMKSNTPASIILDNLQNIYFTSAEWRFYVIEMMRHVASSMPEGMLFAFSITPHAYELLKKNYSAFTSRVHTAIEITTLKREEALAFTQKRLALFRLHPTGNALFPFDEDIIEQANEYSHGIPLDLMDVLRSCIEIAIRMGESKVSDKVFDRFLWMEKPLNEIFSESHFSLKREFRILLETFRDQPFTLEQAAIEMGIPLEREFFRIEELVDLGVLEREKEYYTINRRVMEVIMRRRAGILGL